MSMPSLAKGRWHEVPDEVLNKHIYKEKKGKRNEDINKGVKSNSIFGVDDST